ncbi:MAG: amino acid ABC transporter ATP-binding protein [Christensenellales bacterium]|jgi:polar amino acid transport system ATP-binding protein
MEPILQVKDIKKHFDQQVLKGISFDLYRGDVLAIIGPSGSGKSTLLRCVTQLEQADGGSITVCGKTLCRDSGEGSVYVSGIEQKEILRSVGLVFQNFNLFPHLSVLQNVTAAPIHVLKKKKEQANREAMALLEKMSLSDKASAYPYQLSGGQQQRVSIARALALEPQILFFDEPTSALDPELTGEILRVIRQLSAEHHTMVVVTHEMVFAKDVADRVIFIDQGMIVEQGTPEEVFDRPHEERTRTFLQRYSEV